MTEQNTSLMEKFFRAVGLMHRYNQHTYMEHGPFANPHRGQGRVLAILKMQPEISQKELSFLLDMRAQSLSELLAKLEKAGFITRTASADDARVMKITLTEKGKEAAKSSGENREGDDFFSFLNSEESKNLNDILDKLITELESKTGTEEGEDPRSAFRGRFHGRGAQDWGEMGDRGTEGFPFGARGRFGKRPGGRGIREMFQNIRGGRKPEDRENKEEK